MAMEMPTGASATSAEIPQLDAQVAPVATPVPAVEAVDTSALAPAGVLPLRKKDSVEAVMAGTTGPVANPLALRHERLTGTISKYVPTSGWGFVRSHLFEGELGFKSESIMAECQNYEFSENEPVEFDVQSDERGRPHAVALKPLVGRKPTDCIGQRHRGYVRRFADRWGFLNAAAFDGDLFVHRDNLLLAPEQLQEGQPPLRAGQAVEFDVAVDDRGRTVAKQITASALPRACDWVGRRMHGYIRSFQGAWGFINSDRFAGDLFIHSDSVLPQYQGVELNVGTMVEFDVERDHHRKGGKNRLVARQVAVVHQPAGMQQQAAPYGMLPQHYPQSFAPDPMAMYGAATAPGAYGQPPHPMCYPGAPDAAAAALGYQPPYPYQDLGHYGVHPGLPPQHLPPLGPQPGVLPQYGQPQMPPAYGHPAVPAPGQHPGYSGQPVATPLPVPGAPPAVDALYQASPQTQPQPPTSAEAFAAATAAPAPVGAPPAGIADANGAEVLLHITTHDWEPDQPGQLRVRKGTLVNVSHRAAHGWAYAATVQPGGEAGEPVAEGWVPNAVAKRVSLCRVIVDWPAEGSGTLGLNKGDLIAVSKEADRGWVYGERISPRRAEHPVDGWLPKKVLEYILS